MSHIPLLSWIWLLLFAAQLKGLLAAATAMGPAVARVDCVSKLRGNITFQDSSGNQTLTTAPGDVLTMSIVAADSVRSPLRVKWPGMYDWTTTTTYTYTVSTSDMRRSTPLWVYVYDTDMTTSAGVVGGYQYKVGQLNVTDGRQPATLKRAWVAYASNGSQVPDNTVLWVGTKIRVVAVGQDPLGRPLQYMFWVSRDCNMGPQQEWSGSSSFNYTLMPEDMTPCTRLNAAVKNDDAWGHFDGTPDGFDDWVSMAINVTDGTPVPTLKGLTIADTLGNILSSTYVVQPGSTVIATASAADAAGSPWEYMFTITRDCGMTSTTVQDWSASSSMRYLVAAEDVTSCTRITALLRRQGDQRLTSASATLLVGWVPSVQQLTLLDGSGSPIAPAADGSAAEVAAGTQLFMQALAFDGSRTPMQYVYLLAAADYALQLDRWTPSGIIKAPTKGPSQATASNGTIQGSLLDGPQFKEISGAWSATGGAVYTSADSDACQVLVLLVRNSDGVSLLANQGSPADMAVALPLRIACAKRAPEGGGGGGGSTGSTSGPTQGDGVPLLGQAEASPAAAVVPTPSPPPVVKNMAMKKHAAVGLGSMVWLVMLVVQLL